MDERPSNSKNLQSPTRVPNFQPSRKSVSPSSKLLIIRPKSPNYLVKKDINLSDIEEKILNVPNFVKSSISELETIEKLFVKTLIKSSPRGNC
jgi:hypothetical protein